MALSLSELKLPARTVRALANHGIATLEQLGRLDEASLARMGIGRRQVYQIRRALERYQRAKPATKAPSAPTLVDVWELDPALLNDDASIEALKLDTGTRKALTAFGVASIDSLVRLGLDGLRSIEGISPASLEVIRMALVRRCRPGKTGQTPRDAAMTDGSGAATAKAAERSRSLSIAQLEERGEGWRAKLAEWLAASPGSQGPDVNAPALNKESQRRTSVAAGDKASTTAMRPSPRPTPVEPPLRPESGARAAPRRVASPERPARRTRPRETTDAASPGSPTLKQAAGGGPEAGASERPDERGLARSMPAPQPDSLEALIAGWLRRLDERTRLAVQKYYGLDGPAETGTRIAKRLGVTPGRVYQLVGEAVTRLARLQRRMGTGLHLDLLKRFLHDKGGLASEEEIRHDLGRYVALGALDPVVACRILTASEHSVVWLRRVGLLADASNPVDKVEAIRDAVRACVEGEDSPVSLNRVLFLFCGSRRWRDECGEPTEDFVAACLRTDPAVEVDEAGLVRWKQPRRAGVADLLAQVLSEQGQPAHYSLLAEKVNERVSIDERVSEQSVYAALRRDPRFLPVGRGVFSLAE